MAYKSRVSDAVVRRLPMYYRHLKELEKAGVVRISSQELGERMNLTASQIRQDINCFGGFGQQGYGYHVSNLKERIGEILGLHKQYHMIIIGAGNIGRAVANYAGFAREGFNIQAIFDVSEALVGIDVHGILVQPMEKLEGWLDAHQVDIAVLCVPKGFAQDIADTLVNGGGTTLKMPKWNDLTGDSQVFSENSDIETDKITAHKEIATLLLRAKGWSAHDMAAALAGDDPMRRIAERVAEWWIRDEKKIVLSILKGVFASASMASHVLDETSVSGADTKISAKLVLDAKQLMGDAASDLSLIYMHSAVYTELQKQQLITFVEPAGAKIKIPTYLGYNVICDDSAPVVLGTDGAKDKFTTYLLSRGCIQRGQGTPAGFVATETFRNAKKSVDELYNRQAKVLHPKGMSWIGGANIADETPSNAELEVGTNWTMAAAEAKQVGMVALVHTLE